MKPLIISSIISFVILIILVPGCNKETTVNQPEAAAFATHLLPYVNWHYSSSPVQEDSSSFAIKNKAQIYWYNWLPSETKENEIEGTSEKETMILDVVFDPLKPGIYNRNFALTNPGKNWGGIMMPLDKTTQNLLR